MAVAVTIRVIRAIRGKSRCRRRGRRRRRGRNHRCYLRESVVARRFVVCPMQKVKTMNRRIIVYAKWRNMALR